MRIVKFLPSVFSSIRMIVALVASCLLLFKCEIRTVECALLIGAATDFLDGFIARRFNCASLMGHRIDILGDASCFGILPGIYLIRSATEPNAAIPGILLLVYAAIRIQTSMWICRGTPLPVVGTVMFAIRAIVGPKWIAYSTEYVVVALSFCSALPGLSDKIQSGVGVFRSNLQKALTYPFRQTATAWKNVRNLDHR